MNITSPQLKRLQVLYGQFERHSLDCPGATRVTRLEWAGSQIGHEIASFKDLTLDEGKSLIDLLQLHLGHKFPSRRTRRPQTRKDGEKAGTEGRRDQIHAESTLVAARDLDRIQRELTRLGWNQARLEAFLRSTRSPLKGRTSIHTLGDANKVYWALKHLQPTKERIAS